MTKTKNERITILENEVAELKLIVHELRCKKSIEPSTTNTVEDIIEFEGQQFRKVDREAQESDVVVFDKTVNFKGTEIVTKGQLYKAKRGCLDELAFNDNEGSPLNVYGGGITKFAPENVAVYELIKPKPLTSNQQRSAIIEKAKKFVEEVSSRQSCWTVNEMGNETYRQRCTVNEFIINSGKRTVVVLVKGGDSGKIFEKGIAKCNPNDVFNEHIGKAIALGRALGLDVSEFEQAVQPTVALGQKIFTLGYFEEFKFVDNEKWVLEVNGINEDGHPTHDNGTFTTHYQIINDTNAIYEVYS